MKINKLTSLIKKYHLNTAVDSVKWEIKDKKATINFVTPDRTLVGSISMDDIDIPDCELPIYTTSQLLKLLSVFDSDIEIDPLIIESAAKTLNMTDKDSSATYMLADPSVIPVAPKSKQFPDFEFEMDINSDFISKFNKAKAALPDIGHVTFNCNSDKCEMIVGYSNNNTTRITIPINGSVHSEVKYKSFNSNYLKDILAVNSDSTKAIIAVSNAGLLSVKYEGPGFTSVYYLVEVNHV